MCSLTFSSLTRCCGDSGISMEFLHKRTINPKQANVLSAKLMSCLINTPGCLLPYEARSPCVLAQLPSLSTETFKFLMFISLWPAGSAQGNYCVSVTLVCSLQAWCLVPPCSVRPWLLGHAEGILTTMHTGAINMLRSSASPAVLAPFRLIVLSVHTLFPMQLLQTLQHFSCLPPCCLLFTRG